MAKLNYKSIATQRATLNYTTMKDSHFKADQGFAFRKDNDTAVPAPNRAPPATSVG